MMIMIKEEYSFKKIIAQIPLSLYEELQNKNKFNPEWDSWLSKIIKQALEKEGSI